MPLRSGHSLVEALVALTLVAVAALGAAASVTAAVHWHRIADARTTRGDDLRLTVAAVRAAGCVVDSTPLPATLYAVSVAHDRHPPVWRARVRSGPTALTFAQYCP